MTNRMHAGLLVVVLAGLTGCEVASSPPPTAPFTPEPPAGRYTFHVADVILSGMVYEETPTGRVPIEGVRVSSDYLHIFPTPDVFTDSQGFFSFRPVWVCPCSWAPWVNAGITSLWVAKDGYKGPAGQPASVFLSPLYDGPRDDLLRDVTINGDTRIDIQLVRR